MKMTADWKWDLGLGAIEAYQAITTIPAMIFVIHQLPTPGIMFWPALAWILFVAACISGLVMRKRWGMTLAIVHTCLTLLMFPVGTIFGDPNTVAPKKPGDTAAILPL